MKSFLCFVLVSIFVLETMTKDMMRKSIVFDKHTPDVFYCPLEKPTGYDKLIIKARPLKKLCEYEGKGLPKDHKSDCYQDIDESNFACKEKYRIMMRLKPPGSDEPYDGQRLKRFLDTDMQFVKKFMKTDKVKLKNRL